jgi:multidrug efflux pump subunit AcrA (membrane-fusion protein)
VGPAEHLYHVVDLSLLWIVGDVLESDVRFLQHGQQVAASFVALAGETFRGRIEHLGLTMDPRTRTQRVVVAVKNPGGRLRPGMFGRARVSVEVAREVIVCPRDAVVHSRAGTSVFVQRMPGKYENRSVELGLTDKGLIEVLDGVFPGEQVVLIGNALLAALLGKEHKARVDVDQPEQTEDLRDDVVAVAHGAVELPNDRQALATPALEGRVRRILVEPGQPVSKGDLLAELDSLHLRSVQLELLQSVTSARLIEQSLARLERLDGQGATPRRQIWEMQSELATLQLQAQSLQRQLSLWGLAPEDLVRLAQADLSQGGGAAELIQTAPVRAPASGRIAGFHVVPGQIVRRGEPMFEIHDLSKVWIKGFVYERDADRVQLGQTASAHFAAYPGLRAKGQVVRIAPMMHDRMRVLPVWIEVNNPDHLLKDGMLARLTIRAGPASGKASGEVAQLAP